MLITTVALLPFSILLAQSTSYHTSELYRFALSRDHPFSTEHNVRLISINRDKRVVIEQDKRRFVASPHGHFRAVTGAEEYAGYDLISVDVRRGRAVLEGEIRRYFIR